MKNLKKVLALVVAFSMMVSVVAFAKYADVADDADYAGAVNLLSALEVFQGDDLGNFNPDNTITRAEVAAVVCRAIGLEGSANGAKGATQFADVAADHWASGYVNLASKNGIINGYGDGNFGPEDKVTYDQVVKMVVCALGYEPMAASKGGYPTGYLVVAAQQKITAGVTATAEAARKTVAQIVANAMNTPMMDQTSYGSDSKWEILDDEDNYRSLLTDRDVYVATGVVGAKSEDEVAFDVTEDSDDYEFEDGDVLNIKINGTDIAEYEHQNVDVYVEKSSKKEYKAIAIVPSDIGETLTIISDDIESFEDNEVEYYTDSANNNKTKTIKLDSACEVYLNKNTSALSKSAIAELMEDDDVELVFIENTGDSKYDRVIATKYESGKVTSVEADRDRIEIGGDLYKFDFDDEDKTIVLVDAKGNALTLEDFEEDDVVAYFMNDTKSKYDYIKIINLGDNTVTGTVEETSVKNNKDYVTIDGKDYVDAYGLSIDDEGTFYLGLTGKIIDFDGSAASKNYAFILEAGKAEGTFNKGAVQVKLLTEKDGIVTYDFTTTANDAFKTYLTKELGATDYEVAYGTEAARFVSFKVNAKNEIKSLEKANGTLKEVDGDYNAKTQKFKDTKVLEDDVIIFNVASSDVDKAYTTDIDFLVDDADYTGYVFIDKDGDAVAAILTKTGCVFSDEEGFAIVTSKKAGRDADGQDIVKVDYIKDGEEGTVVFDDDSEYEGTAKIDAADLNVGDIFVFNADSTGLVNNYAVLGQIDKTGRIALTKDAYGVFDEDTEFVFDYIVDKDKKSNSKYINLTLGEYGDISIPKTGVNKYTYNDKNKRNIIIENGDFLVEDVDIAIDDEVSYVLIRFVDDEVVDVYSFNNRVEKPAKISAVEVEEVEVEVAPAADIEEVVID